MNQISENLFAAIDILIQERLKNLSFDKTIIGSIINKNETEYLISYQNNKITAYSDISYEEGDSVYILIPENNFENKCFILGKYQGNEVASNV